MHRCSRRQPVRHLPQSGPVRHLLDFTKQIVFVQIASGPNGIGTSYTLKDGDLTALSRQTLKAGPGFGFGLDVLDRDGIKTYNGKPLDK